MSGSAITGGAEFDAMLKRLAAEGSKKAAKAGLRAMLTPVSRALRAAVNASAASPALKRAARKTVGQRFGKAKVGAARGEFQAKVGFGVGMRTEASRAKAKRAAAGHSGGGVGVSANNIHWFVLGTGERRRRKGASTGRIDSVLVGLPPKALAASTSTALAAARARIDAVLDKEAQKRRG